MDALTLFHVVTGTVAVLAGAVAALTRKGGGIHIKAGRVFVGLMVASSLLGAALGLIRFEQFFITFFAGLLASYLVLSGWFAAKGQPKSPLTGLLALINAATFVSLCALGGLALGRADGMMFGFAGENYLFLAGMSGLGLVSDLSLVWRQTIARKYQVARHLWRMLFGFFIAAGSAFTGPGASAFPEAIQQSGLLSLPELLILVLLLFYLIKTLAFSGRRQVDQTV